MANNPFESALEVLDEQDEQRGSAPLNPYVELIDSIDSERTRALRSAQVQAVKVEPDRAAKVQQLSLATGLAPQVVERNFDKINERVQIDTRPYAGMQQDTPTLADWASDPSNAAVAKDDMEQLGLLEWVVTAPQRAFAQSVHTMRAANLMTKQLLFGSLNQEDRDLLQAEQFHAQAGGRLGAGDSWFRGAVTGGSQLLANVLFGFKAAAAPAAIGAGVGGAIGGAGGALAGGVGAVPGAVAGAKFGAGVGATIGGAQFGFELEAGLAYEEYLKFKPDATGEPLDPEVARAAALAAGTLNAGLEVVGLGILARSIPGLDKLKGTLGRQAIREALKNPTIRVALGQAVKEYAGVLTKETAVEVAQRAVTIMAGELGKAASGQEGLEMRPGADILDDLIREGVAAAQGFVFVAAPGPTIALAHKAGQAKSVEAQQAWFQALAEGVAQSKTIERMPDAAQAMLAQAVKDGPRETLYAPADTFRQYWQDQGLDPAEVAKQLTGQADALEQAEATGTDLAIPTAAYAVKLAGTEHHKFFAEELRFAPGEMNVREMTAFKEQVEAQAAERLEAAPTLDPDAIQRDVTAQLVDAGVPEETAAQYAAAHDAVFGNLARRVGIDPRSLYETFGLKVSRPDLQAVQEGAAAAPGVVTVPEGGVEGREPAVVGLADAEAAALGVQPGVPEAPGSMERARALEPPLAEPAPVELGASGESAASLEAIRRQAGMKDRGEAFVVYDRAGVRRPLVGPEAVDYQAQEGETYGVEGPGGFRALEERGGKVPAAAQGPAPAGPGVRGPGEEPLAAPPGGVPSAARGREGVSEGAARLLPAEIRDYFGDLLTDARARGFSGSDDQLAAAFVERLEHAREIAGDLADVANDTGWRGLLQAISKAGGIGIDAESTGPIKGHVGEIAWLLESLMGGSGLIKRGKRAGRFMPRLSAGIKGAPRVLLGKGQGGLSLDRMREILQSDPAGTWQHYDDINTLLVDLEEAVIKGHYENLGVAVPEVATPGVQSTLEEFLKVRPGESWWLDSPAFEGEAVVEEEVEEAGEMPLDATAEFQQLARSLYQDLFEDLLAPPEVPPVAGTTVAPVEREDYVPHSEYHRAIHGQYVGDADQMASSRMQPSTVPIPPVGSWMIEDDFRQLDGQDISQLVEVPVEALEISEDTGAGRFGDVERYARWLLEGREPPPIQVVQTDRGTLKTLDHRRLLAAKAVGQQAIKAWVSWATHSQRPGNPITGLTFELNVAGARPLPLVPADPERTIFRDDVPRLEALRKQLIAEGAVDVLETGEVQPRLPVAGAVREVEVPTPAFEAPFALTPEVSQRKGKQRTLFQEGVYRPPTAASPLENLQTLDRVVVGKVPDARVVPFPVVDDATAQAMFERRDVNQGQVVTVPLEKLVATQATFTESVVLEYVEQPSESRPEGMIVGDTVYLTGGHHRAIAAWAQGQTAIEVEVVPLREQPVPRPRTFFQGPTPHVPPFFSQLDRVVTAKMPEKAPASQVKAIITNPQNAVRKDELEWSGVLTWLDEQGDRTLEKGEVRAWLETNKLGLDETVRGSTGSRYAEAQERLEQADFALRTYVTTRLEGRIPGGAYEAPFTGLNDFLLDAARDQLDVDTMDAILAGEPDLAELVRELNDAYEKRAGEEEDALQARYGKYKLQGGERYREVLIQLPVKFPPVLQIAEQYVTENRDGTWTITFEGQQPGTGLTALVFTWATSGWGDRNIDFPADPNGFAGRGYRASFQNKTYNFETLEEALFWAKDQQYAILEQMGKRNAAHDRTYTSPHWEEPNVVAHVRLTDRYLRDGARVLFIEEIQSDWHQTGRKKGYRQTLEKFPRPLTAHWNKGTGYFEVRDARGVFVTNVFDENITGEDQAVAEAERRLRVDRSRVRKSEQPPDAPFKTSWAELSFKRVLREAAEKGYAAIGWTTGEQQAERYNLAQHVREIIYQPDHERLLAYDHRAEKVMDRIVGRDELGTYIGEELAKKLLATEPTVVGSHTLEGLDLRVGGEGMKGFYDQILPKFAAKYLKPFGVKPEATDVSVVDYGARGKPPGSGLPEQFATAHGLPITPELRQSILEKGQPLFQEEPAGAGVKRGAITFEPGRSTITLFAKADLSTFLHESGHLFLEVFNQVAEIAGAIPPAERTQQQQAILDDLVVLNDWLGGGRGPDGYTVQQHEQFARGFEAYLFEGRAPAIGLQQVFAKFRAWLLGIYRTIKALRVEVSPEVRGVLDRMFASEAAILEAEGRAEIAPIFLTAEQAGMSAKDFALYREAIQTASTRAREELDRRIMAEVDRERTAVWNERRQAIEEEVREELEGQQVYQALAAIQRGRQPNGDPMVEGVLESTPLRLSRDLLVERYGASRLRTLPPFTYSVEGGLDPDAVAQQFGYRDGGELLEALERAKPLRPQIQVETDRRMVEEFGSMLLDGSLEEQATAAVGNEAREEVVRAEVRALNRLKRTVRPFLQAGRQTLEDERRERAYERRWLEAEAQLRIAIAEGRKQAEIDTLRDEIQALKDRVRKGPQASQAGIPPASVLREAARTRIARTKIREVKPALFWSASRRAAAKAFEAAAGGDYDAAATFKTQELIDLALYREAQRVREEVDARVTAAKALNKPQARARIAKAGENYLDQIDGILDRYEFAKVSQKVLDRRASLRRFVAGLEGEGIAVDLPEELLEETRRTNYQELTVEELYGVTDGLQQILHLARLKTRLLKAAKSRELAAVTGALTTSIREHARRKPRAPARDRRPSEERRRAVADFFAGHRKLSSMLRELDGFEDGGPAWDAIMRPLNDAGNREASMNADATKALAGLVERAFPGREKSGLYEKLYVPAIGESLSRMSRIMVALNWGNEGNRDRMRRGYGWSDQQVQAILDSLTTAELDFAQGVLDFIDSYWPQIEAKQKRIYGVAPGKVEAVQIRALNGTITGGYFPLRYDDRLSASAIAKLDLEAADFAKQAAYTQATTRRGHTKERAATVKAPPRLDFGVIFEHVGQVIHDLTHHEALIDVGRILGQADVQQAILDTQGDLFYKQIRGSLRDVAFGDIPAKSGFERAINHVRMGATVAGLGWNLGVSMLQPIGLANAVPRIGAKWVAIGMARWLRSPATMVETVHWITEKSEFMRARGRTQQREINEIRNQVGVESGKFTGWIGQALDTLTVGTVTKQGIADSYFWFIQQAQRLADVPTWLGAYEKAMAANEPEDRAVALADQAVLDSQGGGQIKDLAQVQRGGPMMRLWTNFYSYFNVVYNQAVESKRRTRLRNPLEVGRLASDYFMLFIFPAVAAIILRDALRRPPEEEPEETAQRYALEVASYIAGTMLGVREVSGAIAGRFGYEGPAGARAFSALSRLAEQTRQGKLDEALYRSIVDVAGVILHFPASQLWKTLTGIAALAEGKTENPGAVVAGPPRER